MTAFLALYAGVTVAANKLLALTADSAVVGAFAGQMLREVQEREPDLVVRELEAGRRRALTLVADGANHRAEK